MVVHWNDETWVQDSGMIRRYFKALAHGIRFYDIRIVILDRTWAMNKKF